MKVLYKGDGSITINREGVNLTLISGVNSVPEYKWLETIASKNSQFEIVNNVKVDKKGLVKESDKIINPAKKTASPAKKKTVSKPKKKTASKKKAKSA